MEDEFLTPEEQHHFDLENDPIKKLQDWFNSMQLQRNSMQLQLQKSPIYLLVEVAKRAQLQLESNVSLIVEAHKQNGSLIVDGQKQYEARNQIKFEKTLKRVEDFLKKKGLIIPDNWREVYWDWYLMKKLNDDDLWSLGYDDLDKIISNEKILIEWARDYTESIDKEFFSPNSKEIKPFKDEQTKNLFEYIVKKWKNDTATKWGYIWNFLNDQESGGMTYKIDYETYLRDKGLLPRGRPNYETCTSEKPKKELAELKKEFFKI